MNMSFMCIVCCLLLFSCNDVNTKNVSVDTVFVNWNKATLQSLEKQIEAAKDSTEINLYSNRVLAFKALVGIDKIEDVDTSSLRYQFLQEIVATINNQKDFYVVEGNRSGEQVEIRNYIIHLHQNAGVDVYDFINQKWVKTSSKSERDFVASNTLTSYRVKSGLGFNQDDVIITHFVNNAVISSEYYPCATLSDASNVKEILY